MGPVQNQEPDPIEQGLTELGGAPPTEQEQQTEPNLEAEIAQQAMVIVTQKEVLDEFPEATKDQVADIAAGILQGDVRMIGQAIRAAIKTQETKRKNKQIGIKLQFKGTSISHNSEVDRNFGMSEDEAGEFMRSQIRAQGY